MSLGIPWLAYAILVQASVVKGGFPVLQLLGDAGCSSVLVQYQNV